ncbi:MAG: peptidase M20 [Flavobacteriaceae bacterium]|nr:peptidase M20 [Flavobacteriaceae bacterium]|tara:strand:+ start:3366 stop:4643 length:1278 start_codon:yes stop_codon:yes gene_type:complete
MKKFLLLLISITIQAQNNIPLVEKAYSKEIKRLARSKIIKSSFDYIVELESFTHDNLIELTEIEAPPFKEHKRASRFAEKITEIGADSVWIDLEGNVLALLKGQVGNRTVALDAHIDTVFPEGTDVRTRISNDTIYAPGVGDDTRGLSMLLTVLKTIRDKNIKTKDHVLIVGTVGEEGLGDLRGVKYLFKNNKPKIDSWIAIDGGEIGRVNIKGLGSYRYRITYKGPGGHSWGAFGMVNPHHALGSAIDNFIDLANEYTLSGPKTSYNIGIVKGGTSINSIPFESIMEVDIRSIDPSRLDTMEALLYDAVNKALEKQNKLKRRGAPLTLVIDKIGNRPSGELKPTIPLIQRALAATEYFEKTPRLTRGSTDSNIPISLGIPAVTIGRGGVGGNAHSLREWWLNKDGYKSIQLALLLLLSEAKVDK